MNRLLTGLAGPVLALSLLAACSDGGSTDADTEPTAEPNTSAPSAGESDDADPGEESNAPTEDATADAPGAGTRYCELLGTDFATLFANIQGPEDVQAAVAIIEDIADEAPEEVADEWQVMRGALSSMQGALTRAAELQKKAEAGEITPKQMQKQTAQLMKDMEALNTPENNEAGEAVATHATEYCGLQLG